jgi:hypothetical protein
MYRTEQELKKGSSCDLCVRARVFIFWAVETASKRNKISLTGLSAFLQQTFSVAAFSFK